MRFSLKRKVFVLLAIISISAGYVFSVNAFDTSGKGYSDSIPGYGSQDIYDNSGGQLYYVRADYTIYFPEGGRVCAGLYIYNSCVNVPKENFTVYYTVTNEITSLSTANDTANLFWDTQSSGGAVDASTRVRKVEITNFSSASSAEVGQSFTVSWSTDRASDGVDLLWGGPVGSGSQGVNSSDSRNFTCSSVGTATFELRASGPSADGIITVNNIITVNCNPTPVNYVNLNFYVTDSCTSGPVSGASVNINQDFGNGTSRTTDGSGFTNFGVYTNTNVGWDVSRSGYNSESGSVTTGGSGDKNVNVVLTRTCDSPPPPPGEEEPPPSGEEPPPPPPLPSAAALYVSSFGASSVSITRIGGPSDIGGVTNYNRSYTTNISGARLRAPGTAPNGNVFVSWGGCDSTQNPRDCVVSVSTGQSKTVTAKYEPPAAQTCQDPAATNYGGLLPCVYPQSFCVAFRADNGTHYLVAEGGGGPGYTINANRTAIGDWEKFFIVDRGGGKVALRTFNNYYAVAEGGGGGAFNADRTAVGGWEEFQFVDVGGGKIAIKTSTGHYVVAEGGGGGAANADRTAVGGWEKFTKVPTSGCPPPTPPPPPPPPSLQEPVAPSCSVDPYTVTLNWSGASDPTHGFFADVTPNQSFSTFWNKKLSGTTFNTQALTGFSCTSANFCPGAPSGPMQLNPGTWYYARIFGASGWSNVRPFNIPFCTNTLTTSINSGSGTITGPGISCPGDCGETYTSGTWITLFANPTPGYTFSDWLSGSGSICSGQGSTCSALIDGNKTARANFNAVPPPFNYSLSNSGTSNVTKTSGNAFTQNTITKTLTSGNTQSITLTLSGVPNGTTYSISSPSCSPTCTSVITFTVSPSTAVGTYAITVTGSPLGRQTTFNLVVSGNPMNITCAASPTTALIGETVRWQASVSGGTAPYSYSWSGTNIPISPAPNSNPFNISYSTIGQKTATVRVTDEDGLQATCPAAVAQINFDPQFEEF